jgi:hypothetical protein
MNQHALTTIVASVDACEIVIATIWYKDERRQRRQVRRQPAGASG